MVTDFFAKIVSSVIIGAVTKTFGASDEDMKKAMNSVFEPNEGVKMNDVKVTDFKVYSSSARIGESYVSFEECNSMRNHDCMVTIGNREFKCDSEQTAYELFISLKDMVKYNNKRIDMAGRFKDEPIMPEEGSRYLLMEDGSVAVITESSYCCVNAAYLNGEDIETSSCSVSGTADRFVTVDQFNRNNLMGLIVTSFLSPEAAKVLLRKEKENG